MPTKKIRRRKARSAFDESTLKDDSLVTIAQLAEYSGYKIGYLYNKRKKMLPPPVYNPSHHLLFRWHDAKAAIDKWVVFRGTPFSMTTGK